MKTPTESPSPGAAVKDLVHYCLLILNEDKPDTCIINVVREDIPCREIIRNHLDVKIEGIFLEISTRKQKWLLFGVYCNNKSNIGNFLNSYLNMRIFF